MKTPHTFRKSELSDCIVCGGFEGTITTDCCGRRLTPEEEDRIYNKSDLDFRDGQWVDLPNSTIVHSGQGPSTIFRCVDGNLRTADEIDEWLEALKLDKHKATEADIVHALGGDR